MSLTQNFLSRHSAVLMFLLLPAVSLAASIAAPSNCPVTNNNCTCVFNDPFYSFKCTSMREISDFGDVIADAGENAAILELDNVNLEYLPVGMLQNSSLHTLIVGNSSFERFGNFSSQQPSVENLHHLSLENVVFKIEPRWQQFSQLKNLQLLFMCNTTVQNVIGSNFSRYISRNLEALTITESNLTDIEEGSLRKFRNLKTLRISHSKISTFSRTILPQSSKLQQLQLDYNKIHSLPSGVFQGLPNLNLVSLSNNTLSTLSQEVFGPLWKSDMHLDLRGNPLKCDCRLLWAVTSQTKPRKIIGECSFPKKLFGKIFEELVEEDLKC